MAHPATKIHVKHEAGIAGIPEREDHAHRLLFWTQTTIEELARDSEHLLRCALALEDAANGLALNAPLERVLHTTVLVRATGRELTAAVCSVLSVAERLQTLTELRRLVEAERSENGSEMGALREMVRRARP